MRKASWIVSFLILAGSASAGEVRHGLSTKFTDVTLGGLNPGMVYSVKQNQNLPYQVTNMTDKTVTVEVVVEKPRQRELRDGYEPVPDISWVRISPSVFTLKPGESTDCDVVVAIPPQDEYADRHFQAMLVTQTLEEPGLHGVSISFALASRLRFSTGLTPQVALQEHRRRILDSLMVDLEPMSLFVEEKAVPGEELVLDGFDIPSLQLVNRSREEYEIEFLLAESPQSYGVARGYEHIPDEFSVVFVNPKLKSRPRSIEDVEMRIKVPKREEFYGKSYAAVVFARILWLEIPVDLYGRVYFSTEEKP